MKNNRHGTEAAFSAFLHTPLQNVLQTGAASEEAALALFHSTAACVPAYRQLLNDMGINPADIQTLQDFALLPVLTKQNYILQHKLPQLCRNGKLEECDMVSVSSGSTGQPCFWPRSLEDELVIARRFEQIFYDSFQADTRSTLAVVCFALGTWVGGMFTAACCRHLAAQGYAVTTLTPGTNREEIFRVVQELGPYFNQTVLLGYPPFLKGVVDEGRARGVDWQNYRVRWVLAGEVFSEEWRTLMGTRLGSQEWLYDSAALYGTADAGVLGCETPLSICIRRWLAQNPSAARQIFGEARLPALMQYDPAVRYFETEGGQLIFSGQNGIPLVRYNILDTGGIMKHEEMLSALADFGFQPMQQFLPGMRGARNMPFVWVFGRSDFTVSFYGANIYPENISVALEQQQVSSMVTGRFVLETREDADRNACLQIAVELTQGEQPEEGKAARIAEEICAQLMRLNSEFAAYVPPNRMLPQVNLYPAGHSEYFPAGVKHRYTRKPQNS